MLVICCLPYRIPALIVLSSLAVLIALLFAFRASRRWAAVGRVELRLLFVAFGVRSAFQIVTMTSLLKQGSKGLVIVSAIHIAIIVVFFWILLGNALIATQVVEWVYKYQVTRGELLMSPKGWNSSSTGATFDFQYTFLCRHPLHLSRHWSALDPGIPFDFHRGCGGFEGHCIVRVLTDIASSVSHSGMELVIAETSHIASQSCTSLSCCML